MSARRVLSHWQNWKTTHSVRVAMSALVLNATLFGNCRKMMTSGPCNDRDDHTGIMTNTSPHDDRVSYKDSMRLD